MDHAGADEISSGPEQPGRPWPRGWPTGTALIAALSAVLGWRLHGTTAQRPDRPTSQSAVASPIRTATASPPSSSTAEPTGLTGPVLREGIRAQLVVTGRRPVAVDLPSGRMSAITGLRRGHFVGAALRLRNSTLLAGSSPTGETSAYTLADGTTTARQIEAPGDYLVEAAADRSFWVYRSPDVGEGAGFEERSSTGALLRRVTLPRRWMLIRGVRGGLLIGRFDTAVGPHRLAVWDPVRRRARLSINSGGFPIGATSTHVAWPDQSCLSASAGCIVHITDVRTGANRVVALPSEYATPHGALSADGSLLAVVMFRSDGVGRIFVAAVETGHVSPVTPDALGLQDAALQWTPDDDAVLIRQTEATAWVPLTIWRLAGPGIEVIPGEYADVGAVVVRPAP